MTEREQSAWAKGLLLKVHVITGWTIPNSEELLSILSDQFQKNLCEKFPLLNVDEIEYAFRKKGTTIEDWGKAMNLSLLDSVLLPYLNDRFMLSEDERKVKEKPIEQLIFTQEELDNSAREDVERQYRLLLNGVRPMALQYNKPILVKDGLMKEEDKVDEFFKSCFEKGYRHIYVKE